MHHHAPEGFLLRHPTAKKIHRVPLVSAGPNEKWSGDGHDKLNKLGLGIYGIRDFATGKWLDIWALPDNRNGKAIGYLYLSLVEELGGKSSLSCSLTVRSHLLLLIVGIPGEHSTSDCGSETTYQYGLAHALR